MEAGTCRTGIQNPSLVAAMHAVAVGDDPDSRKRLYEELLKATLVVPVPQLPDGLGPGNNVSPPGMQVGLLVIPDAEGRKLTPAFTDDEAVWSWSPAALTLGLPARVYFQMVLKTPVEAVILNPFDPARQMVRPGGRITRVELEALADGAMPAEFDGHGMSYTFPGGQRIHALALDAVPRRAVCDTLARSAEEDPRVAAVHLFQFTVDGGAPRLVAGLTLVDACPRGADAEVVSQLGRAVQPLLREGESLDFVVVRGAAWEAGYVVGLCIFRRS